MGGTQGAGTRTGRQESLGERGGPEQSWIGTASMAGLATREKKNINKRSTLVGYVLEYGRFYGGGSGRQTGGGTPHPFRNVQHPERSEQGNGIRPTRNVPG